MALGVASDDGVVEVSPSPARDLLESAIAEARAELWRRREFWPLMELYLDRDQLADLRAFFEASDGDGVRGKVPSGDWCDDISRQRGKSWKWTCVAVAWCHCFPGQSVKYLAQFGTSVRGIIAPTIALLIADMPPEFRPKHRGTEAIHEDKQDHKWHFPHRRGGESVLHATGANNQHYKALRGPRAHWLIQDECAFYDDFDDVQSALRPMLTTTLGACVYPTTPPVTPAHPYERTFLALKAAGRISHHTIHNHPRLSPEDIQRLLEREAARMGMDLRAFKRTTFYRREYLCLHVLEESRALIPEWNAPLDDAADDLLAVTLGSTLTLEVPRPVLYETYTSADFGFTRHPTAVLFAYWDFPAARLVVVDELGPLYRTRTDQLAKAYREKMAELWPSSGSAPFLQSTKVEGGFWAPRVAIGDKGGRGEEVLTELAKEHGLAWTGAVKEADLEVMVNDVRRLVSASKLVVHPRCKNLLKQLATGLWADKSRSDFEESAEGHLDFIAALVYLVRAVDRQSNPIPVGYGTDPANTIVVDSMQRGGSRALEEVFG